MSRINADLGRHAKIQIVLAACHKLLRGSFRRLFLRKSGGALFVGKQVTVKNGQFIEVGAKVKFEDYAEIQGLSTDLLIFGDYVTIGRATQIRPSSYYGVGQIGKGFRIGSHSSIGPNSYIGCAGMIEIGNDVLIGPHVTIIAENHKFSDSAVDIKFQGVAQKGVTIEDNVWIGANVTILDGVTIGSGAVIGATTLVTKDVPANTIYINKRNVQVKARI
ncbi:acyltransferase [Levilactobacillus andaensis]|uniref:acyltransferase n=1 Tax=Levilactobacillus andaensis TaxID=2799570 RepID=UPI0019452646|nr:acyltransferase [Levilactobacillus andaensis]